MTQPRQHLIVFAKAPQAGFAKTRLIPALGAQGAADLAKQLFLHTAATASSLDSSKVQNLELCCFKNGNNGQVHNDQVHNDQVHNDQVHNDQIHNDDFFENWLAQQASPNRWQLTQQTGPDLGARMHHALSTALTQSDRAIVIGTDSPALTAAVIEQAFKALDDHDAVFIPAFDGGYALVGLRAPIADIFNDMVWGTPGVMTVTRRRLKNLHKSWFELPRIHDIDEPADLNQLPAGWL